MQIAPNKVVTLNYTLKDDDGNVIDSSNDGSFAYLHGANNIIVGLEQALSGKTKGDELNVSIAPADAYGVRDESRTQVVSRANFPEGVDIAAGMQFQAQGPNGETLVVTVVKTDGDSITVDGNHPLAGMQLNFDVTVMDVRDASPEEIEHRHVHGPGGHHHD